MEILTLRLTIDSSYLIHNSFLIMQNSSFATWQFWSEDVLSFDRSYGFGAKLYPAERRTKLKYFKSEY